LPRNSYTASQADVAVFKALSAAPNAEKYPNAARWYKHIASYEDEFATLSGDATKPYTTYGPDVAEVTLNPAKAPAAAEEEDDDVDLFGSDDEEEDAEAVRVREERLAAYKAKKDAKPKLAAKSIVTIDVKPWGMSIYVSAALLRRFPLIWVLPLLTHFLQMTRPTWLPLRPLSVALRRMASSGVLPSSSPSASVSRSSRSTSSLRTRRSPSPTSRRRLRPSRTTSSPPMSPLCRSFKLFV